jgi:hypothetical protein
MFSYEVLLGVDRAARDTGRRITMRVRESDPLSAALCAEKKADRRLRHPEIEYTHAISVQPVIKPAGAAAVLRMAA